jgi:hypothetical protein
LRYRDTGLYGPSLAEVVAVEIDRAGAVPVLRDAPQPLRLAGTVVALDGVEQKVQAAGAELIPVTVSSRNDVFPATFT